MRMYHFLDRILFWWRPMWLTRRLAPPMGWLQIFTAFGQLIWVVYFILRSYLDISDKGILPANDDIGITCLLSRQVTLETSTSSTVAVISIKSPLDVLLIWQFAIRNPIFSDCSKSKYTILYTSITNTVITAGQIIIGDFGVIIKQ